MNKKQLPNYHYFYYKFAFLGILKLTYHLILRGWIFTRAMAINDAGWIVGRGSNPDGKQHAFLLIPESSTLGLVLLGGLLSLRGRRKLA
ncbi:MAG: PEP-CTERM sorting domain-containing protein [Phycisphaerae bacterium]|nr:PEP-CTERM sorting domain-containing protein [Phycisphaerae bacterium]